MFFIILNNYLLKGVGDLGISPSSSFLNKYGSCSKLLLPKLSVSLALTGINLFGSDLLLKNED
jgi:hypothetical protein